MIERSFILRDERERERASAYLRRLDIRHSPPLEIVFREMKIQRSTEQNKRYWAILREISEQLVIDGQKFSDEALHEWFKRTFIGAEEVRMPDGRSALFGISTTTLSVGEFGDYMTQIESWSSERGVVFSDDADRAFRELAEREA